MEIPFVGASGAIFGLFGIAALSSPMEKVPTILIFLTFLPLLQFILTFLIFLEKDIFYVVLILLGMFVGISFLVLPSFLPMFLATLAFIFSWVIFLILNPFPIGPSNIGHLGGLMGGLVSIFFFPKQKT